MVPDASLWSLGPFLGWALLLALTSGGALGAALLLTEPLLRRIFAAFGAFTGLPSIAILAEIMAVTTGGFDPRVVYWGTMVGAAGAAVWGARTSLRLWTKIRAIEERALVPAPQVRRDMAVRFRRMDADLALLQGERETLNGHA